MEALDKTVMVRGRLRQISAASNSFLSKIIGLKMSPRLGLNWRVISILLMEAGGFFAIIIAMKPKYKTTGPKVDAIVDVEHERFIITIFTTRTRMAMGEAEVG